MNRFSSEFVASVKNQVVIATQKCRDQMPPTVVLPEWSDRARKIITAIKGAGWSAKRMEVISDIASVALNEDLSLAFVERPTQFPFVQYSMIVPVRNLEGHSYSLGAPCLVVNVSGRVAIYADGRNCGSLDPQLDSNRPASDEEIGAWFSRIRDNDIFGLFTTIGQPTIQNMLTAIQDQ